MTENKASETSDKGLDKYIFALYKKHGFRLSNKNRDKRTKEIMKYVLKNCGIYKKDLVSYFVFKFGLAPKTIREDFINQLVSLNMLQENAFGFITIDNLENSDEATSR